MAETLAMFPLGTVVLPGAVLPLHVFEPRYRALIHHCIDSPNHDFGVVLIARGSEVGGGDVRTEIGTRLRLVEIAELPDGRYAALAVGVERLRVVRWLDDDPYPRADVEPWPDEPLTPDETEQLPLRLASTAAKVRRCAALALELGDAVTDPGHPLSDDPVVASFQLAGLAPVGALDRHQLLAAPHSSARLTALELILDDVEALLQFRLHTPPDDAEGQGLLEP